jgi:hypothetical protein
METSHTKQNDISNNLMNDLGAEIETYPIRNRTYKRVVGTALGTSIILGSVSYFTMAFFELVMAVQLHGRAMVLLHASPLILMLAFLPLGVIILLHTAVNWDNRLQLFERGIFLQRGLRKQIWAWVGTTRLDTHITHIKFGGSIIDIRVRFILGSSTEMLVIHNQYEDMSAIIHEVRARVLPIMVERATEILNQGRSIEFSKKLSANLRGLLINGDVFPWNQLEPPIIKNRKLVLRENKNQEKVLQSNIEKITNLDLLVFMLNHSPGLTA